MMKKNIHIMKKITKCERTPLSVLNPNALEYTPSFTGNTPFPLKGGTKKLIKKRKQRNAKQKPKKQKESIKYFYKIIKIFILRIYQYE